MSRFCTRCRWRSTISAAISMLAPALLELGLGFGAETAIGVFFFLDFGAAPGIDLRELVLLSGDLDHQALAQIPRRHAGRVKVLHQLYRALYQI